MSEEQLSAFLAAVKEDPGLQEKLKCAADLDAFLAMTKEAGFDISKASWLRYQANQLLKLSDEELEGVAGGGGIGGYLVGVIGGPWCPGGESYGGAFLW
jgi:predicted ribosomally synthesized peptide with nif11-like leader